MLVIASPSVSAISAVTSRHGSKHVDLPFHSLPTKTISKLSQTISKDLKFEGSPCSRSALAPEMRSRPTLSWIRIDFRPSQLHMQHLRHVAWHLKSRSVAFLAAGDTGDTSDVALLLFQNAKLLLEPRCPCVTHC